MSKWIVRFPLKVLAWALGLVGFVSLALTAMVAAPLTPIPELTSISKSARAVDRSTMPPLSRFSARDGTELAYRHYPSRGPSALCAIWEFTVNVNRVALFLNIESRLSSIR